MEDKVLDTQCRAELKDKKRIVVKVGTSSLIHVETGELDLIKVEHLVRELTDLRSKGKDVILVTSGAIGVGSKAAGFKEKPERVSLKAGLCGHRAGTADDDLPEVFRGV